MHHVTLGKEAPNINSIMKTHKTLRSRIEAKHDPELLQQTISTILDELSDYEKAKKQVDSHVEVCI